MERTTDGGKTRPKEGRQAAAANRRARGLRVGLQSHVPAARHRLTCLPAAAAAASHARTQAEITTGKCRGNSLTQFQATAPLLPLRFSIHLSFISLAFRCDEVLCGYCRPVPLSRAADVTAPSANGGGRAVSVADARATPLLCLGESLHGSRIARGSESVYVGGREGGRRE